jgi:hypothetical protein
MDFLTREVFDTLIIVVIIIGLGLAVTRLYADFTRPLPPNTAWPGDDTDPHRPQELAQEVDQLDTPDEE